MPDSPQPSTTVYLASVAALLGGFSMGLALVYTTPAFPGLEKDILSKDSTTQDAEKSLIGSMLAIGALVGGLINEPCNKLLGRRLLLILVGIPFSIGWIFISTASGVGMLVWGRILKGFCCGLISGTAPTYVVEIAPPSNRGLLGTCFQVMAVLGILAGPVFGLFCSWRVLASVGVVPSVITSILMFFMPETPQWLLSKRKNEEAEYSLKRLRSSQVNEEFSKLTESASNNQQSASPYSVEVLTSREFLKPCLLALALMFFQQFSGINAIIMYQTDILKKAASNLDVNMATIYVFAAQVVATIVGSLLVDRLGRRILLLISGAGHVVSLTVFGLYSHISATDSEFKNNYAWLALASLIVFISLFSVGYGPIPWMLIPELSSARVRSMVSSFGTAINWTFVAIITAYVKSFSSSVGDDWTNWIFAIICLFSCVFVLLALPETKGKSSDQIQRELLGISAGNENSIPRETQLTEKALGAMA